MSYLHSPGHGLWSQLFAVAAFFPSVATSAHIMLDVDGRAKARGRRVLLHLRAATLLAAVTLSNLFYGYMAMASVAGFVVVPWLEWSGPGSIYQRCKAKVAASFARGGSFVVISTLVAVLTSYFVIPFMVRSLETC